MAENAGRIPTPADFLSAWQQMASQSEGQWNDYLNKMMGTESFANMLGRYMEGYLTFQGAMSKNIEKYMQSVNLPVRSDITALGERLAAIEERLGQIAEDQRRLGKRLESLADAGAAPKRAPARAAE